MDLNQITLDVADFGQSVAFYRRLGFRLIVSERDVYARFELPSGATTFSVHRAVAPRVGGAVLYLEVDDVDATHARLTAQGVEFESCPVDRNWRWREARFYDPTGHAWCLFHAGADRRFPPWRLAADGTG
ncbi:VOC family protein [Sulfitobacter albidus]|uniref:VOC family protein n=1 Tax=Sulfitobacter albidus TaxID=2829501 RepID=A0A975JCF4_9RHOB|nr:VOC family protein [Sulfitobacter albidus]QUJ75878.1 VOC family protein [Sulfitobacter albidus]